MASAPTHPFNSTSPRSSRGATPLLSTPMACRCTTRTEEGVTGGARVAAGRAVAKGRSAARVKAVARAGMRTAVAAAAVEAAGTCCNSRTCHQLTCGLLSTLVHTANRYVTPLPLGSALIEGLAAADEMLVRPALRAKMEVEVTRVADGHAPSDVVLKSNLDGFSCGVSIHAPRSTHPRSQRSAPDARATRLTRDAGAPYSVGARFLPASQPSRPNLVRCAWRCTSWCPTLASWEGRMRRESEVRIEHLAALLTRCCRACYGCDETTHTRG